MNRFVSSYLKFFAKHNPTPRLGYGDAAASAWVESQRLDLSGEGREWLDRMRYLNPSIDWGKVPIDFYECYAWGEILLPLFDFMGCRNANFCDYSREFVSKGLWPIGLDSYSGGTYVVDLRVGTNGVVAWLSNGEDLGRLVSPLATSMSKLFDTLSVLIDHHESLYGGNSQLREHAILAARLEDPEGWGGDAWEKWWKTHVR